MIEESTSNDSARRRPVLGDLTNLPAKRPFSAISDCTGLKSVDKHGKNEGTEDVDPEFAKRMCSGVVTLVKENSRTQSGVVFTEKPSPPPTSQVEASNQNVACIDANKLANETKLEKPKGKSGLLAVEDSTGTCNTSTDGGLRYISISSGSTSTSSQHRGIGSEDEGVAIINAKQSCNAINEGPVIFNGGNDDKDIPIGQLGSGTGGLSEWLSLPKSQSSGSFEVHRCSGFKSDNCLNVDGDVDLLNACSCSFCSKAAYIWSDLHYQDIKGRLAVLKKSQREANNLAQRCGKEKNHVIHGQVNTNRSSKLEADLTNHWKSLFLSMEGIFVQESSQLQAGCVTLKDIRESCKVDLEKAVGVSSEKQ